jgi:hypothetical protein
VPEQIPEEAVVAAEEADALAGSRTFDVEGMLAAALPHLKAAWLEELRERVYRELTGQYMPDHVLIGHLNAAFLPEDSQPTEEPE